MEENHGLDVTLICFVSLIIKNFTLTLFTYALASLQGPNFYYTLNNYHIILYLNFFFSRFSHLKSFFELTAFSFFFLPSLTLTLTPRASLLRDSTMRSKTCLHWPRNTLSPSIDAVGLRHQRGV